MTCKCGHEVKDHTDNFGCQMIEADGFLCDCETLVETLALQEKLAALLTAGNAMRDRLLALEAWKRNCKQLPDMLKVENIFVADDAAALAEWEQVTK